MKRCAPLIGLAFLAAGCASPPAPRVNPVTAQFAANGAAAFDRAAYPQAAHFYEKALQSARANDDGPEIARAAYNLAACRLMLGQPADARIALREALHEFGRWRMDSQPALLLDAKVARAAGQPAEAQTALDLAFAAAKTDAQRAESWLLRGELAADAGDGAGAAVALRAADSLLKSAAQSAPRAELAARIAALNGLHTEAARGWDTAAAQRSSMGQSREMAAALSRAGDAWSEAGDARAAADRYLRSSRSFFAQGDPVAALKLVDRGLAAAAQAGDADAQARLTDLFGEITRAVQRAR